MKFRGQFDYDCEKNSDEFSILISEPSLTVQSMAEDADINVLMERYGITGKMPESPVIPSYGDFSEIVDYQSALNAVIRASDSFMELPAKLRARFSNNPQEFLEFCSDDANIDEARKLGLLKEKVDGQSGTGSGSRGSPSEASKPAGTVVPKGEVVSGGGTAASGGRA